MTNFDKIIDRRNTDSLKWDVSTGELPMWVADMDFETAPCVKAAIVDKARRGVFGYETVPDAWYDAISNWWQTRHNWQIQRDWLCFVTGVVPAITSCVKCLTSAGDNVCVMTPAYDIFFHSVENTGRRVLESPLSYDGNVYNIDFDDLEQKLSRPLTTLLILCNPANPVGRVWSGEELAKVGELCRKHGVKVISDEIHCDLTEPSVSYVPFASVSAACADISVTAVSASKAFNIAGMQSAAVVIPNEQLRSVVVRALNYDEIAEPNSFACTAAIAAFSQGGEWLDELRRYISDNRKYLERFVQQNMPFVKVASQQATYLLWLDCSAVTNDSQELCDYIRKTTGLYLNCGAKYRGNGRYFVRVNAACPRATLQEGLRRFQRGVESYLANKGIIKKF